jgi:hypothetical protein
VGNEGAAGLCDGYDNNCDNLVDEGCPCEDGSVQECFAGPPGRVATGACRRGVQVCNNALEFGGWGDCKNGIAPSEEICDRLDNDCNGCVDEREDCDVFIDCPGEGDPRIPQGRPFETYALDAAQFYNGNDVTSYRWTVSGSPCDDLFASIPGAHATSTNGRLSYTLHGANQQTANVRFTLSGTYLVSFEITRKTGQVLSCTFPMRVGAAGLRVELCWDKTGPTSAPNAGNDAVDLDLHLAMKGQTASWDKRYAKDCYYETCVPVDLASKGIWQHPNTPGADGCTTGGELDQVYQLRGNCMNPRLDLDNQGDTDLTRYLPENINLDNPRRGEIFQVAVNHTSPDPLQTHALVNVYCGGKLKGSFDLTPNPPDVDFSGASLETELWRVVEVAPEVDDQGVTTDCALTPLHPAGSDKGPWITQDDLSITWTAPVPP